MTEIEQQRQKTVAVLIPELQPEYQGLFGLQDTPALYNIGSIQILEYQLQHLYRNQITRGYIFVQDNVEQIQQHLDKSHYSKMLNYQLKEVSNINETYCIKQLIQDRYIDENDMILLFKGLVVSNINIPKLIFQYTTNYKNYNCQGICQLESFKSQDAPAIFTNLQREIQQISQDNSFSLDLQKLNQCTIYTSQQFSGIYYLPGNVFNDQKYINNETIEDIIQKVSNSAERKIPRFCLYKTKDGEIAININNYQKYRSACKMIASGYFYPFQVDFHSLKEQQHVVLLKGTEIDETAQISNCQIGSNNWIKANVQLKNSILMNNCKIGQGVQLEDCLLHDNVTIKDNLILPKGSVIGKNATVNYNNLKIAIYFYIKNIWDDAILKVNGMNEQEIKFIKNWSKDVRNNLNEQIVKSLPPIYMMNNYIQKQQFDYIQQQMSLLLKGQEVQLLNQSMQQLTTFCVKEYQYDYDNEVYYEEEYEEESYNPQQYINNEIDLQQPVLFNGFYIPDYLLKQDNKTQNLYQLYFNVEIQNGFKMYQQQNLQYNQFLSKEQKEQYNQANQIYQAYNNYSIQNKIIYELQQILINQRNVDLQDIPFTVTEFINNKLTQFSTEQHDPDSIVDTFRPQVIKGIIISSLQIQTFDNDQIFDYEKLQQLMQNLDDQELIRENIQKLVYILLRDKQNNNNIAQNNDDMEQQINNIADEICQFFGDIIEENEMEVDEVIGLLITKVVKQFLETYTDDKEIIENYVQECRETEIDQYSDQMEYILIQIGKLWDQVQ